MHAYFRQLGARRWAMLAALAMLIRAVSFLPVFPHTLKLGLVLGSSVAIGVATIGLAILIGRQLRAHGHLAEWYVPSMGISVFALVVTNPLFAPGVITPAWVTASAWVICTIGLMVSVICIMAIRERQKARRSFRSFELAGRDIYLDDDEV